MKRRFLICCFLFAALTTSTDFLMAQDVAATTPADQAKKAEQPDKTEKPNPKPHVRPGKGPALTEAPQGDLDFDLMGEFIGPIATDKENKYESLGLQIRPIGHDQFQATAYFGGLPGQKTHRPQMTRMIGRRSEDLLILSGGPWAVFVEKDGCLIVGRDGKQLGRLERIERISTTMHATAPADAVVMFDGSGVDQFSNGKMTADGLLEEGCDFKPMFQDFNMHVEFRLPYMPQADGQARGNSGLYLQGRYECQVLDSFGTETMINGLGALYQFKKPELNMCFPPLVWQTYDVQFTAPRWAADGSKVRNAHISSWINGVKVQNNVELPNKTGAGKPEEPLLLPTKLQDHGDPVRFRNIWVVDRGLAAAGPFPVLSPPDQPTETKISPAIPEQEASKDESEPGNNQS